jgi:integrase
MRMGRRSIAGEGGVRQTGPDRSTPKIMQIELFPCGRPGTFGEYALAWHRDYCTPPWVTAYTSKVRLGVLRAQVLPALGDLPLADVGRAELERVQRDMLVRMKPQSVRHTFTSAIGPVLRRAYLEGLLTENPMRALRWPRIDPAQPVAYSDAEVDLLLAWFRQHAPQFEVPVALVMLAGLRPSEACGLRWGDIERRQVLIVRSVVDGAVSATKTERSIRRITVSRRLSAILERRRGAADEWVAWHRGRLVRTQALGSYWMGRACAEVGIPHRGLYAGRRHMISASITDGAEIGHVAAYTGTSVTRIARHYFRYLGALSDPRERARRSHRA